MKILVTSQHMRTILMLQYGEVPAGVNVDVPSLAQRRGVGFKSVTTAILTVRLGVATETLATWLYDKLCGEPTTRLTINRTEVPIAMDEISRVIQEEITKGGRMASSGQSFREFEQAGWENPGVVTKYHEHLSGVTIQSTSALLDAAGVGKGSRVLDVATGAGYVAGAAAQRGADATGIDFSAAQIRLACETYPAVRFEQADAEALPFEPGTFDAVVNGFGMCHLPNPDRALREAFRVLKPGGRLAFAVWDVPARVVGFGAVYAAVRAHGSMDVGLPVGPNFFFFSDPEQSTKALRDAGFVAPSCRQVPQVWRLSAPDQLFEVVTEGSVRAAATIRSQSPAATEAIRTALRETVKAYKHGDYFELPMPAVIASAVKS